MDFTREYCHPMSPVTKHGVFANQERFHSPISKRKSSLSKEILLVSADVFSCLEMFAIIQTVTQ